MLIRFARIMRDRIEPMFGDDVESAASLAERWSAFAGPRTRGRVHTTNNPSFFKGTVVENAVAEELDQA